MTELEQLKKFAEWERTFNCDEDENRIHIIEWAVAEIERLRSLVEFPEECPFS